MCAAYITGYVLTFMHNLAHTFKPSHIGALGRSENHGGEADSNPRVYLLKYIPGKMEGMGYVTLDSDGSAYTRRLLLCFL